MIQNHEMKMQIDKNTSDSDKNDNETRRVMKIKIDSSKSWDENKDQ